MKYPDDFASQPLMLTDAHLEAAGFRVQLGVLEADVPAIAAIAAEPSIREYCPRDQARFGDRGKMQVWLTKDGGRAMFILRRLDDDATVTGYGWTGPAHDERLPDCNVTFAVRLHPSVAGQGLAVPFSRLILTESMARFGAGPIGLETWASNTAAVRTYLKSGALLVTTQDADRPTLAPKPSETDGRRRDVRLYLRYA